MASFAVPGLQQSPDTQQYRAPQRFLAKMDGSQDSAREGKPRFKVEVHREQRLKKSHPHLTSRPNETVQTVYLRQRGGVHLLVPAGSIGLWNTDVYWDHGEMRHPGSGLWEVNFRNFFFKEKTFNFLVLYKNIEYATQMQKGGKTKKYAKKMQAAFKFCEDWN